MSSSTGMSSLPTTLPSSAELLQLLQEQAALQLLMSVRSSVFLVSCCTVRRRSTCFGVSTRPPCMHYRYNRSCAIERTCRRVVRLRINNFLPSADTFCWVLSALSTIHASTLYPEEGTRSILTPSLTRLSQTLEATTFDLVLLAAHAEEVKCGMVKVLVFSCVPWYLTWQWLISFLNTITWLDQDSHKVAFALLAVHKRPFLSCSWGGDEHFISESFFQMHMLSSKRRGSDSCLTKVAVIRSANLRQPNN